MGWIRTTHIYYHRILEVRCPKIRIAFLLEVLGEDQPSFSASRDCLYSLTHALASPTTAPTKYHFIFKGSSDVLLHLSL